MSEQLKPCPFCGGVDNLYCEPLPTVGCGKNYRSDEPECWWAVKCTTCGNHGPTARPGPEMAIASWSQRLGNKELTAAQSRVKELEQCHDVAYVQAVKRELDDLTADNARLLDDNVRIALERDSLRELLQTVYNGIHRGVGPMASASDSEIASVINDTMCNIFGNDWKAIESQHDAT